MKKVPVDFDTTTQNGYRWPNTERLDDWDWAGAWIDPGGTIWGPGPYLKVAYCGYNEDYQGFVSRVKPREPRKPGEWNFVLDKLSPTGWAMQKVKQ